MPRLLKPAVAGRLMERELEYLGMLLERPARPFAAILGGAKISGKIDVITSLLDKVDRLLIGGAMMFTFLRAQGRPTGRSLVEEDRIETARSVMEQARARGVELLLPVDCVASTATNDEGRVYHTREYNYRFRFADKVTRDPFVGRRHDLIEHRRRRI